MFHCHTCFSSSIASSSASVEDNSAWSSTVTFAPLSHLHVTVVIKTITYTSIHASMMSSGYMHLCYLEQQLLFVLSYSVSAIKKEEPCIDHHKLLSESEMLVIDFQLPFRTVVSRERMKMSNHVLEKKKTQLNSKIKHMTVSYCGFINSLFKSV